MEFMRKIETPVPGRIGRYAAAYLGTLETEGKALATRYEYWRELTRLGEELPDAEPAEITTMDIERFLAVRCHGSSLATRKKVVVILSGFFTYLQDRDVVAKNPTRPIRRPRLPEPEVSWWSPDEVRAILAVEMNPRDRLLLTTLARTGQRVGVVRTLRWSDLNLDGKEPVFSFRRGKGGRVSTFPIDNVLLRQFVMFKELTQPEPDGCVFKSRKGGPLSTEQISRIIARACEAAGVRRAAAHEFRRSCITNLLHAGAPFDLVSRDVAGHKNPQTTMRHYRGSESARVREAMKGLPY
jgi:integrase/recombinase XerD